MFQIKVVNVETDEGFEKRFCNVSFVVLKILQTLLRVGRFRHFKPTNSEPIHFWIWVHGGDGNVHRVAT